MKPVLAILGVTTLVGLCMVDNLLAQNSPNIFTSQNEMAIKESGISNTEKRSLFHLSTELRYRSQGLVGRPAKARDYSLEFVDPYRIYFQTDFISDLRKIHEYLGGSKYDPVDNVINSMMSRRNWARFNLISAGRRAYEAIDADPSTKQAMRRVGIVYDQLPNIWHIQSWRKQEDVILESIMAIVSDPTNLIPIGSAFMVGSKMARAALGAGHHMDKAIVRGVSHGTKVGLLGEGILSGTQEAGIEIARQARDISIQSQRELRTGRVIVSAGVGFTLGASIGGVLGAVAGTIGAAIK